MLDCSYLVLPATCSGYKQNCCKLPGLLLLSSKYYSTRRPVLWKLFVCCICQVLPPATAAVDIPLSLLSTSQNTNLSLPVQIWGVWCLMGIQLDWTMSVVTHKTASLFIPRFVWSMPKAYLSFIVLWGMRDLNIPTSWTSSVRSGKYPGNLQLFPQIFTWCYLPALNYCWTIFKADQKMLLCGFFDLCI